MDVVYIFQHSQQNNREIQYSLRSVAQNLPWVRKVWILGDRPSFLTAESDLVQHVSHQEMAWIGRWRLPVRNNFILTLLASLIPGLADEFLWFADDYVILNRADQATFAKPRAVEHNPRRASPGRGLFQQALWRTKETLARLDYPAINFEAHLPQALRREWVWHAFRTFRDFVSEDRFHGLLAHTAILNYAVKKRGLEYQMLEDDERFVGIYPKFVMGMTEHDFPDWQPQSALPKNPKISTKLLTGAIFQNVSQRKTFLSFNDETYPGVVEAYLAERFGESCRYEQIDRDSTVRA